MRSGACGWSAAIRGAEPRCPVPRRTIEDGHGVDWALAEHLAFATLLDEGFNDGRIPLWMVPVAFMGNGQHLFYRKDMLELAGITEAPTSWEDVLVAAKAIKDAGITQTPLAASVKPGWDLAAEFVNAYLGTGADFFAPGSAELAIDNESGRKVLEVMRAMTEYMDPNYLTFDANSIKAEYEAGKVAMMNEWGSLAGATIPASTTSDRAIIPVSSRSIQRKVVIIAKWPVLDGRDRMAS